MGPERACGMVCAVVNDAVCEMVGNVVHDLMMLWFLMWC